MGYVICAVINGINDDNVGLSYLDGDNLIL